MCQCFVFCALLEFALVNYASRSDMQRDRARERNERARRQWELEHADMEQAQSGMPGVSGTTGSSTPAGNNGPTMNHIGSSDTIDGIPGYSLVSTNKILEILDLECDKKFRYLKAGFHSFTLCNSKDR